MVQHEISRAADEGLRAYLENAEGDVAEKDKAAAMKLAAAKKTENLIKKMNKLTAIANPDLTPGFLKEVSFPLLRTTIDYAPPIFRMRTPLIMPY